MKTPTPNCPDDPDPAHSTRPEDRVGFWEKTALGAGFLPIFFGNAAVKSFALPVYQMTLGMNPVVFGLVMALPRFWDAITDPIMGYLSDNLHTKWGRRRPLIILGAILQAIAFGVIWMVPESLSEVGQVVYLSLSLIAFYTCYTIFSVPFISLSYEMTPDYDERTRVQAFGGFFGKIGEFLYQWIFPLTQLAAFGSVLMGVRVVGWSVGILIMGLVAVIPGLFVKERYYQKARKQDHVPLWSSMAASFRNQAFIVLVGLTVLQILAGIMASSIDYYLLVYHMCDGDIMVGSVWKAILSMGYAIIGIAAIFPTKWLAIRFGKQSALGVIFFLVLIGAWGKWVLYTPGSGGQFFEALDVMLDKIPGLATPGNFWKILIDPLFCGPIWIAINVLTPSMFADVCDADELRFGRRREGIFGAAFSWIQKTGYSLAFFGTGVALVWTGFDEKLGGAQPEGTLFSMRLVLAISTAAWAVLAIALLFFYPLTRQRMRVIRDELEARRGRILPESSTELNTD